MMMTNGKQVCLLAFAVIHATHGASVEISSNAKTGTVQNHDEQEEPLMRWTTRSAEADARSIAEELQQRAERQKPDANGDALIQLQQESVVQTIDSSVEAKSGHKLMLNDVNSYAVVSSTDTTLREKARTCVNRDVPAPCGQAKVSSEPVQSDGKVVSEEHVFMKIDACDVQGSDQKWQLQGRTEVGYIAQSSIKDFGRIKIDGVDLCLYAESADSGVVARGCAETAQYMWRTEKDSSTIKHEHTSTSLKSHCLAVCTKGSVGCTTDAQKSSLYLKECDRSDCNQKFSLADPS